ncbi:MAG TPA: MBOAT family O-acyltransferase, partial [Bacteroidia bacterium]|nr:MBOAT family O-acyltransferase [Bacteroidia bacterium]
FNEHVFNSLSFYTRNLGQLGLFLSVTITFSIIGVWHGATLGFLVFGVLNGIAISIEMLTKKMRKKIAKKIAPTFLSIIGHTYLFLLVAFLFVFVKTASLSGFVLVAQSVLNIHMIQDTVLVFNHFIHHVPFSPNKLNSFTFIGNLLRDYNVVIVCAAGTLITLFNFIKQNGYKYFSLINYFRYTVLVVLIMQFGVYHNAAEFVYFKF